MSRALLGHVFVIGALASCATVSGLADKETVDCPGCPEDVAAPARDASSVDSNSNPNPPSDASVPDVTPNFTKPDGWQLVAVADVVNGEESESPACPSGFGDANDIGTSPSTRNGTCECACNVTVQAACTGAPEIVAGIGGVCDPNTMGSGYANAPAGGCLTDFPSDVDRTGRWAKVKLAAPSGGTCAAAPNPRPDRVSFTDEWRVCGETARCNGNACDDAVPAPFRACLASPKNSGDVACPPGFPTKIVAGGATVSCAVNSCSCNVTRTPCTGTLTYYKDTGCATGPAGVAADDTCRNLNSTGKYAAYKVVANTTTGCTAGGIAPATVTPADVRTVCCR